MKEHNEIDALFESAFDGLTLTPDTFVKENIDRAIASKKKRRRFLFWLFPVAFGALGLGAIFYFQAVFEGDTSDKKVFAQRERPEQSDSLAEESNSSNNSATASKNALNTDHHSQSIAGKKMLTKKKIVKTTSSATMTKSPEHATRRQTFAPGNTPISPDDLADSQRGTSKPEFQPLIVSKKPENNLFSPQDSTLTAEKNQDSTLGAALPDSTLAQEHVLTSHKSAERISKWSLVVLTYWEGEKKRTADLANEPFINFKRETGTVHSSTFYGKIEFNYKINRCLEALTGIGFRSSRIVQYGYVDTIEIPLEGLGSAVPITPPVPDTLRHQEAQSFRVNSIVLPIGFGYSLPLGTKMRIRLSAGAEFAYGQFARQNLNSTLSDPTLRPFGCSVWARPELCYSFGKIELLGFGTFNQTLSHQLRWNFEPRRNPAFGGGIGLRIRL